MCPRMDLPRNRHAERIRQILSTRGLTVYRASQLSAQMFGRSSPFYLPPNLYHRLAVSAVAPGIYQLFALSRVTNYRLSEWLGVFGFDLDVIPQLQALVERRRTVILDSSVYDRDAWVTWFTDRPGLAPAAVIAPLGQLLARARPKRARELLAPGKTDFLYAKVGHEDLLAFPDVAPGSIVRIDTRQAKESPSLAKNSSPGLAGRHQPLKTPKIITSLATNTSLWCNPTDAVCLAWAVRSRARGGPFYLRPTEVDGTIEATRLG
jgi:hypothetical protein